MLSFHGSFQRPKRKGIVLLATMVVIVLLSLTAYHFSDHATQELKAAHATHRQAQAKAVADSGIHYAMAWLANYQANLATGSGSNDNPYYAPDVFLDKEVKADSTKGYSGKFTLIAPVDPGQNYGTPPPTNENRFGVTDETGKINLNAFLLLSGQPGGPSSQTVQTLLSNMLLNLPNINGNQTVVNSILDWLDYDTMPLTGGQETYGNNITPRNGPLDSIEELALVQMVSPSILYGNDRNRNGKFDPGEEAIAGSSYAPGLWDYLTTYSRELLVTPQGQPMAWLNDTQANLQAGILATTPGLGQQMINYLLLARQNGGQLQQIPQGSSSSSNSTGTGGGGTAAYTNPPIQGNLNSPADLKPNGQFTNNITSIWQLVNSQVVFTSTSTTTTPPPKGKGPPIKTTVTTQTIYTSPLQTTGGGDPTALINMFLYTTPWGPSSGGGGGGGGGTGVTATTNNNSSSPGSNSSNTNSGSSSNSMPWTGPSLIVQPYERPARININTCHPDVLNALFTAISQGSSNNNNSSSTTGATATTPSQNSSSAASSLLTYVPQILQMRPQLGMAGPIDPNFQTPVWLATQVGMSPALLQMLEPYITTTSQVFRVQSVGVLDGREPTTVRVEAVIDTNGGLPRILAWRDLTEFGKGVETKPK